MGVFFRHNIINFTRIYYYLLIFHTNKSRLCIKFNIMNENIKKKKRNVFFLTLTIGSQHIKFINISIS